MKCKAPFKDSNVTEQTAVSGFHEFDGHEFVISLNDPSVGLRAYIGIHNTNLGVALGGTRMINYASEHDAIRDVLNLSKAMSYKCALARLPFGGGKAVIMLDEKKDRDAVLFAYGRLIEKLRGLFKTGTDVGITDEEVRKMATQTQYMLGVSPADRGGLTTASVAALGVFYSMKAALRQLRKDESFDRVSVAIKGVGKLGGELARLVVEAGGRVVIADVDSARCQELALKLPGIRIVPVDSIHRQEALIYAPCALGQEFTPSVVAELRCSAVVGGANNQLADPTVGEDMAAAGILYAPDYIANAGGLIYVADELEADGFSKERVLRRTRDIQHTMATIFKESQSTNRPANYVADELAEKRMKGKSDA